MPYTKILHIAILRLLHKCPTYNHYTIPLFTVKKNPRSLGKQFLQSPPHPTSASPATISLLSPNPVQDVLLFSALCFLRYVPGPPTGHASQGCHCIRK